MKKMSYNDVVEDEVVVAAYSCVVEEEVESSCYSHYLALARIQVHASGLMTKHLNM